MSQLDANQELLAQALAGDSGTLERLLWRHFSQLERHIAPRIPDRFRSQLSVEDVLQDVFVQAFRDIKKFEVRPESSFYAWLRAIADHRLADAIKRLGRRKRGGEFRQLRNVPVDQNSSVAELIEIVCVENYTPGRSVARHEMAHAIQVGVASLPDDQREVIQAKFFEGRSLDEIAADMGRTKNAVRGLIHRAQKNLSDFMGRSSKWFSGSSP